jgi:SAM-dependent methyltransferase
LNAKDIEIYRDRYESRLAQHGYSPESLGWGKNGRQDKRFAVFSEVILQSDNASVLDVGCGFGDLYMFLKNQNWGGKYTGIDIVGKLLEVGRDIFPGANLIEGNLSKLDISNHDYVVESGIFNAALEFEENDQHIEDTLKVMYSKANIAVIADFMSTYVDFQKEGAWHSDPAKIIDIARKISKRFILRYDYMPFEFTLIIFKDDAVSDENIFIENV